MKWLILAFFSFWTQSGYTQLCNLKTTDEHPDSRYEYRDNGAAVYDRKTGLTWQRCVVGMSWNGSSCVGYPDESELMQFLSVQSLSQSGWRLPNVKELSSILKHNCLSNSVNQNVFPNLPSYLWSSSMAYHKESFWVASANGGYVFPDSIYNLYSYLLVKN